MIEFSILFCLLLLQRTIAYGLNKEEIGLYKNNNTMGKLDN